MGLGEGVGGGLETVAEGAELVRAGDGEHGVDAAAELVAHSELARVGEDGAQGGLDLDDLPGQVPDERAAWIFVGGLHGGMTWSLS